MLCKFKPQELAVYAVYPERRNLMPKVRAFVDFLATTFGPEPPWEQGWTLPERLILRGRKIKGGRLESRPRTVNIPLTLTFYSAPKRLRNPTL